MRRGAAILVVGLLLAGAGSARAQTEQWVAPAKVTAAWTSATTLNTASTVTVTNLSNLLVSLKATSTMTGGALTFEADEGSGTWWTWPCVRVGGASATGAVESTFSLAVTTQVWECEVGGWTAFRVRLSTAITGTGTATVTVLPTAAATEPAATVQQPTAANLNATVTATNVPTTVDTNTGSPGASTLRSVLADGLTECNFVSAASTNATSCKASAGQWFGIDVYNTTTTTYYLRLYNLAAAPTCSSATGFIKSIPIPAAVASGTVGGVVRVLPIGVSYGTGIAWCITGGSSSTDNTNAAVGLFGTVYYR